jgi:hypothetical protein
MNTKLKSSHYRRMALFSQRMIDFYLNLYINSRGVMKNH